MAKNFDTLVEYGNLFQIKTISVLLKDKKFLDQIYDIIDRSFYDSDSQKWIVKVILEYYTQYRKSPTLDVFKVELNREITNEVMKQAIVTDLKNVVTQMNANDLEYVKENFLQFAKNQSMKKAIYDAVDDISRGNYEVVRQRVDKALKAGETSDMGVYWKSPEQFNDRVTETLRSVISTPWELVNEITEGGLGKGELGVIMGGPGIGKSWNLVSLARHAAFNGKNVIYYTLELNENYVALRHDANETGFASQDIKYHQDEVLQKLARIKGNILVKYYPTKTAGIETLRSHVSKCISNSFQPHMIIVDYADLLRGNVLYSKTEKRFELENIYEDLRGLGGEFEVPCWTGSQVGRSAATEEIVEGDKISEAYSKLMIADFVASIQRKTKDKIAHTGRFHVVKNRFGPDGMTFPFKMNAATGQISMYLPSSEDGKQANRDSEKGELLKKRELSAKLDDILGKTKAKKVEGLG